MDVVAWMVRIREEEDQGTRKGNGCSTFSECLVYQAIQIDAIG